MFQRGVSSQVVTIPSGANLSDAFDFRAFSFMTIALPAAWTSASIGFKACLTEDGTFLPVYDDDGNLCQVDSPTADKVFVAPARVASCHWIKLWSQDGSAANTNQGGDRVLTLGFKA